MPDLVVPVSFPYLCWRRVNEFWEKLLTVAFSLAASPVLGPLLCCCWAMPGALCFAVQWPSCCTHWTEECAIQRQCNREWDLGGLWSIPSSAHQPCVETGSAHAEYKSFWGSLHIFLVFISLLLGCCVVSWSLGIISMCSWAIVAIPEFNLTIFLQELGSLTDL